MVRQVHSIRLACLLMLGGSALVAKDLAVYRVGDTAAEDLTTPVALDVVAPDATAALQASEAMKVPSVFRSFPNAADEVARDFLTAFVSAHTNFTAALVAEYNTPTVDQTVINSENFGYFITAFNVRHKEFPVSSALAAEWASGKDGGEIRDKILGLLQQQVHRPVRPDGLPKGFYVGETLRLVPVSDVNQKLSFADIANGKLLASSSLTTVSRAQTAFRREFSSDDQPLALALAGFIKPTCALDASLTQSVRADAVRLIVVAEHFDAGQIIVHRGSKIDDQAKIALDALNDKLKTAMAADQVAQQSKSLQLEPQATPLPISPSLPAAAASPDAATGSPEESQGVSTQMPGASSPDQYGNGLMKALPAGLRNPWLLAGLAALVVAVPVVLWRRRHRHAKVKLAAPAPVVASAHLASQSHTVDGITLPAELAPQVAQAVREAVMQELALQRRELMLAQQTATDELSALVQRLDDLQLPMQERLRTYEVQIQKLEKELAVRTEENRQLLKLKIDMMRRQLETERSRTWKEWTDFNN